MSEAHIACLPKKMMKKSPVGKARKTKALSRSKVERRQKGNITMMLIKKRQEENSEKSATA